MRKNTIFNKSFVVVLLISIFMVFSSSVFADVAAPETKIIHFQSLNPVYIMGAVIALLTAVVIIALINKKK